jgi:alpha-tubulin suppressor-like RCC1 family protein
MCTRSTYRFIEHYEKFPLFIKSIQKYTPFFKSGHFNPRVEAEFDEEIVELQMGCGFVSVIDSNKKAWTWGDNYGSQLGTKDDVHREDPCIIKSMVEHDIV